MKHSRLLYLDAEALSAWQAHGKSWQQEAFFPVSAANSEAFTAYLQKHRQTRFRLLLNLASEDMLIDDMPRLRGRDREAYLERKLRQHFPESKLRTASSLGPKEDAPGRELLALNHIPYSTDLAAWLTRFEASSIWLDGIYSISQVIGQALPQSAAVNRLICLKTTQELRQFLLTQAQTRFLRSQPIPTDPLQETEKLLPYLLAQRLYARDHTPTVELFDLRQAHDANPILINALEALEQSPPKNHFSPDTLRKKTRLARLQHNSRRTSGLFIIGCTCLTLQQLAEAHLIHQETGLLQQEQLMQIGQAPEPPDNTPDLDSLRWLNGQHRQLEQSRRSPQPALEKLSHLLDQHRALELHSLHWSAEAEQDTLKLTLTSTQDEPDAQNLFGQFLTACAVDRALQVKTKAPPINPPPSQGGPQIFHLTLEIKP